jgi:poly [ADP-ribose] polymerase 2/3/4
VLVLAEVALGKTYPALEAEDLTYDKLRASKQCDSLHGVGKMAASEEHYVTMTDGVVAPVGELEPTGVENSELLYNEFVVYRREQVRLRYLVVVDFVFNDCEPLA